MGAADAAEQSLKAGDPAAALAHLQEQVRAKPADPKLRVFLFQLLCVLGQWERALTQLKVASELDASTLAMAQTYREAVRCEAIRTDVFAGKKSPMVFGEPAQWLAFLIESLLMSSRGDLAKSDELRRRAFDNADTTAGEINGQGFSWIADADSRLGPVLEAIINGRYYWVPFERLSKVTVEPPVDLRDVVWMPAHLEFENGGDSVALIPTRYPGSQSAGDGALLLARRTEWDEVVPGAFHGRGQRTFITDSGEVPLMELRSLTLRHDAVESDVPSAANHG
jgi:type VI secretion system protein ImpE